MTLTVGELVAYLSLDDKNFQAGVQSANRGMEGLKSAVNAGATAIGNALNVATGAAAGLGATLLKQGAAYNQLQQNSRAALKAITGSAEAANAQMDKLDEFARSSPFSKATFITAQQQLLAFGVSAEKVIPTLDALQQAVAATGGSNNDLGDLAFIFAQISAAGKITGQDLLQFGQRGVNAAKMIGDALGKTPSEVKDLISKGKVDVDQALDAITTGMQTQFGGATAAVKEQWSGAMDRIKASIRDIGADMAKPFIDPNGGGQMVVWGNRVADVIRAIQPHVRELTAIFQTRMTDGGLFTQITVGFDRLRDAIGGFDPVAFVSKLDRMTDRLRDFPQAAGLAGGALFAFQTKALAGIPVIGQFVTALNPLAGALGGLVLSSPALQKGIGDFVRSLQPVVPALQEFVAHAANLAERIMAALGPALADLAEAASRVIIALAPMAPALVDAASTAMPLVQVFADIVSAVAGLPTPVLAAVTAMLAFQRLGAATGAVKLFTDAIAAVSPALSSMKTAAAGNFASAIEGGATRTKAALSGIKGAAGAAAGGIGAFAAGLGPAGWAAIGLTAAVGTLTAVQARNAEKQKEAADAAKAYAESLDQATGAATASSDLLVRQGIEAKVSAEQLKSVGVSYDDIAAAAKESATEQQKVYDAIQNARNKHKDWMAHNADRGSLSPYKSAAEDAEAVAKAVEEAKKQMASGKSQWEQQKQAADAAATSYQEVKRQLEGVKQAQDQLNQSNMTLGQSMDRAAQLTEEATQKIAQYGQQTADSSGRFSSATEAGRSYNETLRNMAQNYNQMSEAQVKAGQSGSEVRAQAESNRLAFIQQAVAMGASEEQANALADAYLKIPSKIQTDAELNVAAALQSADDLVAHVDAQSGTITINGSTVNADITLGELIGNVDSATGTVTINGNQVPANQTLFQYLGLVNNSDGTVTVNGDAANAYATKNALIATINRSTGHVDIRADDSKAKATANAWSGRVIGTAWVRLKSFMSPGGVNGQFADGGFQAARGSSQASDLPHRHRYAANGLASRQAMYARGGSWITWAEDETQGEWYIPAAWSKRARSMKLLAHAADHFGLAVIPKPKKASDGAGGVTNLTTGTDSRAVGKALRAALTDTPLTLRVADKDMRGYLSDVAASQVIAASRM